MLLLSAHIDTVYPEPDLRLYTDVGHEGLLDNQLGIILTYAAIYSNRTIREQVKRGEIRVWHDRGEEFGMKPTGFCPLRDSLVICVDVASGPQYRGVEFSLENCAGMSRGYLKGLVENLRWEGFKCRGKMFNGDPDDEDEGWQWKKLGVSVISFILPIKGRSWHQECTCPIESVERAKLGLIRTICYTSDMWGNK